MQHGASFTHYFIDRKESITQTVLECVIDVTHARYNRMLPLVAACLHRFDDSAAAA